MSSAGRRGAGDTGKGDPFGAQGGSDINGMPRGTDIHQTDPGLGGISPEGVDVVEVVTFEGSADPFADTELYGNGQMAAPGFRWWYVPAVAVPVAVGSGALVWYLTNKNRQMPFQDFSDLMGRRSSDFADWMQDRVQMMRRQQPVVKGKMPAVRGKTAAIAGAAATAPLWNRAGDWLGDQFETVGDQFARIRTRGVPTTKAKTSAMAKSNRWVNWDDFTDWLEETGGTVGGTVGGWWEDLRGTSMPAAATSKARNRAKKVASTGAVAAGTGLMAAKAAQITKPMTTAVSGARNNTARAVNKTGKSVNSAWRQTRTFTFAMLLTAMYTYMRMWRQRLNERTMRETASGRLESDREPTFTR
jgi:hypothetical protein